MEYEEVTAEVVSTELAAVDFAIDLEAVNADIRNLEEAVGKAHTAAAHMAVDADALATMDYAMVKNYEQGLSAAIKDAEEARKRLKRDYSAPLAEAEAKFKAVMDPVVSLHAAYKGRRVADDERAKSDKYAALAAFYEDYAPFIALPGEGQREALVPFSAIFEDKWLNKSAAIGKCKDAIAGKVDAIAEGEALVKGMGLKHEHDALAAYFATLSVEEAVKRDKALTESEERMAVLIEARVQQEAEEDAAAARREELYAMEMTAEEAASGVLGRGEQGPVRSATYRITFEPLVRELSDGEKLALIVAMKRFGIHGKISKLKGDANV